jgi:hypothetical protein
MPASTYVPLSSVTLSTAQSQVTFSNIPQTYTDLVLIVNASLASGAASLLMRYNSDSGTNYSGTRLIGNGSAASSERTTSSNQNDIGYFNTSMCNSITSIQNYSNSTTYKTCLVRANTSEYVFGQVQMWRNTAAVTSISITNSSAVNFNAGTTFNLYGVGANQLKATGGDIITTDGTYWYHAFKTSGTFTPQTALSCDVLVVGGGGGGSNGGNYGGGGGAGKVFNTSSENLTVQAYTCTIGAGGAGNSNGSASTVTGTGLSLSATNGDTGSGTTGGESGDAYSGGTGSNSSPFAGGGGGGSTAVGANAVTGGGNGGAGNNTYSSWLSTTGLGVSGFLAGGGGGASGATPGFGGSGGGGAGGTGNGNAATANTGSGGGGAVNSTGGTGGSGLVIVRYAV